MPRCLSCVPLPERPVAVSPLPAGWLDFDGVGQQRCRGVEPDGQPGEHRPAGIAQAVLDPFEGLGAQFGVGGDLLGREALGGTYPGDGAAGLDAIESATHEAKEAEGALDEALAIVQDCHATYIAGDPERRRLMNQAIFERILIRVGWLEGEEEPVYEHIRSLGGSSTPARPNQAHNGQDPQFFGGLGSNVDKMVRTTTVISNHELQGSLGRLAEKLARLRTSDAPPRAITSQRHRARRPGWVQDAVVRVLADHEGPMRPTQVHAAVEALLGESVSPDSVSWALASDVRCPAPRFVRVARGRYVLARAA